MSAPNRPTTDVDTESWWAAVQDGTLTVTSCAACLRRSLHDRPFCPYCWSEDVAQVAVCGRAVLYTWTVVHQNAAPFDNTPYVVAMVDLEEGPRLMTAVEDCPFDDLAAGMELQLEFRTDGDGFVVPIFRPMNGTNRRDSA